MRNLSVQTDVASTATVGKDPSAELQRILDAASTDGSRPSIRATSLYYLRQVAAQPVPWIPLWVPEYLYVCDVGRSALASISVPYGVPRVPDPSHPQSQITIGLGDPNFPDFKQARVFSAATSAPDDLLYACVAGNVLVSARDGVTLEELRDALRPFVQDVQASGHHYKATVVLWEERVIATRIKQSVPIVEWAETNGLVRNNDYPWFVDRVV